MLRFHEDPGLLDEKYARCEPCSKINVSLYLHQQVVVQAMLDLEQHRCVSDLKTRTCAGVLSEKLGSGKTLMLLSLVGRKARGEVYSMIHGPNILLTRIFSESKILSPTIIFAAPPVVLQWEKAIRTQTTYTFFTVKGIRDLRRLNDMINDLSVNAFDIILVKNGKASGDIRLDCFVEVANRGKSKSIPTLIANMTRKVCWNRVIYDDCDTSKLPTCAAVLNGQFTWFVSASNLQSAHRSFPSTNITNPHNVIDDIVHSAYFSTYDFFRSAAYRRYNIRGRPDFVEQSMAVGKPRFYRYVLSNPNGSLMNAIGELAGDMASNIMEMLNGDAIELAAEHAGIKSDNIADIFKLLLDGKYAEITYAKNTIKWLDEQEIPQITPPDGMIYTWHNAYKQTDVKYNFPNITQAFDTARNHCIKIKKKCELIIDRVTANIQEEDCPLCYGEFKDDNVVIMKCCGRTMCADCGIYGSKFYKMGKKLIGRCVNCRRDVGIDSMIFLAEGFDLSAIDAKNIPSTSSPDAPEDLMDRQTKIDAMIMIIKSIDQKREQIDIKITGMIRGTRELPCTEKRKVIVFSRFDISLDKMEERLREEKVRYARLNGRIENMTAIVDRFHKDLDVLLINGEKYSSGLNLQCATDLIFMHKIKNKHIEAQIAGRIQRMGRTSRAHIHYITYENEEAL